MAVKVKKKKGRKKAGTLGAIVTSTLKINGKKASNIKAKTKSTVTGKVSKVKKATRASKRSIGFKHKHVDIYIKEVNGTRKIRVPWLPASIEYDAGGQIVATYDILNRGEVAKPTGSGLAKIRWDSQFPGKNRTDKSLMRGAWMDPSHYHKIMESWMKKGTALNVLVTGYPINKDVHLSSYTCTPAGGFGDMEYSVEFTEDRDITITSKKKKKDQNSSSKRKNKKYKTYTVKKGDTLWKIAKKTLGSGKKWKEIYKLNKTIIEKTAKKRGKKSSSNGRWIYPGTKLQIPKTGSLSAKVTSSVKQVTKSVKTATAKLV